MTILAAIGEERRSDEIVSVGYDLASAYQDTLSVLHVIPEKDFQAHQLAIAELPDFDRYSVTQEGDSAAKFAERVVSHTLEGYDTKQVASMGRVGEPAENIIDEATSTDPRFIVIGGKRRTPVGKAIFGSVTQNVLLSSEWPVVTVMLE